MRLLGQLCLLGAFVGSGYATFACIAGWRYDSRAMRRSGIAAATASMLAISLAVAVLVYALLVKDFSFAYVAQYSNRLLPRHYSFSSLWVGQAGSLLLWAWFSAVLALAFRFSPSRQRSSLREPAFGILMGYVCFLVGAMVFAADPMAPSILAPSDGAGLSPLLQHPAMLIHPPIVFLGFSGWTIPFALAATALVTGRLDSGWVRDARPWALFSWTVLGAGILLGAEWAYEELGWGGYWGWDPVENGSLIPWLIGTASIHTLMAWRNRGVLKKTGVVLAMATFGMCNFSTFITRSGIFSSLHAFSQSRIGWLFLVLMVALALGGGILVVMRRGRLTPESPISTLWARESMVVVATIAILALTAVVCAGTLSAALSQAVIGRKIVVGVAFYNNVLIPTGLLLLAATAMAPLLKWGAPPTRSQTRLLVLSACGGGFAAAAACALGVRHPVLLGVAGLATFSVAALAGALYLDCRRKQSVNRWFGLLRSLQESRRQYAGFVIHMGLVCLALGVTGSSLGTRRHEAAMAEGDTIEWAGRRIRFVKVVQRELPDKLVAEAQLEVARDGYEPDNLWPAKHFHLAQNEWTTEVAIQSGWSGDFYTILHSGEGRGRVRLTFVDNPMMRWIWLGGCIMGVGAVVGLWPVTRPSRRMPGPGSARAPLRRRRRPGKTRRSRSSFKVRND